MRLLSLSIAFFITTIASISASQHTFIVQDVDSKQFLIEEGDTTSRLSPYSSFKIVLSLIGFNTNVLQDTETTWPYKEEYKTWNDFFLERWAAPHSAASWIKNSCLWYSQALTQKVGMKSFADHIVAFGYGNQDLSGDAGKENGLTNSWLGSSLRVSPLEQVHFINQLVKQELPVSERAHELTKSILFVEKLPNDMLLYGKTGTGSHAKGQESDLRVGWFVGWIEKENRRISFVYMVQGTEPGEHITGLAAKGQVRERLLQLQIDL